MPYTPVPVERFGGLKLDTDPGESAQYAIAGSDFDLTPLGQVVSRKGYDTVVALTSPPWAIQTDQDDNVLLVTEDLNLASLVGSTLTEPLPVIHPLAFMPGSIARFTVPAGEALIVPAADSVAGPTFFYVYDVTTGVAAAVERGYSGVFAAVQNTENRLVFANTSDSIDHIRFSAPGDEGTWGANDYVILAPGSGGGITGLVSWRNSVFAFKRDRFFEFYGNTTDAVGNPVFNYREVNSGIGAIRPNAKGHAVCVAEDGIYFCDHDGVYRTTGGPPAKVSAGIDPLFVDGALADPAWVSMAYHRGRVFLSTDAGTWVYWIEADAWLPWSLSARGFAIDSAGRLLFSNADGDTLARLSMTATTDGGTAITTSYQSGWGDFGYAQEKTIRETILWGEGDVAVQLARDYDAFDTGETLELGATHAAQARRRTAVRGTEFSYKLSGTAPWAVNRLIHNVRGIRSSGVQTAA